MATSGIDAVNLILEVLFECEAEGKEIDIQDLRDTTEEFLKENEGRKGTKEITQIIEEAIKQFEDLKKMEDEN